MAVEKAAENLAGKGADAVDKIIPGGIGKKAMWLTGKIWKISTSKWTFIGLGALAVGGIVVDPATVLATFKETVLVKTTLAGKSAGVLQTAFSGTPALLEAGKTASSAALASMPSTPAIG